MDFYKLMPPPIKENKNTRNLLLYSQKDNDCSTELDKNDQNLKKLLAEINYLFIILNADLFFDKILALCQMIEDKNLTNSFEFFQEFSLIDSLINSFQVSVTNEIYFKNLFHLLSIFTKFAEFQVPFHFDQLISVIHINKVIACQCSYFFETLSNFIINENFEILNCPDSSDAQLMASHMNPIDPNIIQELIESLSGMINLLNLQQFQAPLMFFEIFTRNRIEENISGSIIKFLHLIAPIYRLNTGKNNPTIELIAKILLNLTFTRSLNIDAFYSCNFGVYIRNHIDDYIDFVKMVGYFAYYYDISYLDVDLLALASKSFIDDKVKDGLEYNIWAVYNFIVQKKESITEYYECNIGPMICEYLIRNMDNFNYTVKRESVMLISLICSIIPFGQFTDTDLIMQIFHCFCIFSEEMNDDNDAMIKNILMALNNIYQYFEASHPSSNDEVLIEFDACRKTIMKQCNEANKIDEFYFLEKMKFEWLSDQ